ncbi:hypothetical protein TIFTF001_020547 [Ficus carica]|uniref:Ubiquitin-like protease family profile domain-containing protein n=1 Tax=Ficus carica TaxID=3494 RepID=A0AA88AIN4_FICCA|nr:hypothetical protein TIFTF001_020547 [Ficus carica]
MSQDHEEEYSTQTQIGKPRRTNSPRFNPDKDGKRRATLMRRVHQVRIKGERIEVSFDAKGQPLGKEGDELQSWIGVLAREHIPIWISDFRSADLAPRKERVWVEVATSFTVELSFKKQALKSCAVSAKNFRYDLYQAFVRDHIDEENILSEQGSEIRKKSKYGSTGGRDGYKKRDQAHAERHARWLDMRVKLDGEFKNEAFKRIADTIDDFSEQETQGSFESMGTNNILTKALGNAEHSVSDMKRQLAALERTVQELCAKHGINRETMAEETTAPTVDQHNSCRASCTLNEKKAGPSDLKPIPNASKECQPFLPNLVNGGDVLVAIGKAYMDCVPTDTVHGIPLDSIMIYIRYLADCCGKIGMDQRFKFISPVLVSPVQQNVDRVAYVRERAKYILWILRNTPKGKRFLMPYNSGQHWILTVIDPWDDSVMYFNPLGNEPGDDFKDLITTALNDWKLLVGSRIKQ